MRKRNKRLFLKIASFAVVCFTLMAAVNFSAFANAEDEVTSEDSEIMVGIDVSEYNGSIDWAKVKAAGVQFAMIRICARAGNTSDYVLDSKFEANVKGATEQGIHVGAYFFSYAEDVEAVKEEANMVVGILDQYPATFSFPIVFDAEEGDPEDGFDITPFAAEACQTFCKILEENGYYAMVYANTNWFNTVILPADKISGYSLWQANFKLAYAEYTPEQGYSVASDRPAISSNNENVKMWQFTDSGIVDGISVATDLNVSYCDFSRIIIDGEFNKFHTHDYRLTYDENEHYKKCACGEIELLSKDLHSFADNINEAGHYEYCFCGFERLASEHVFDIDRNDAEEHWSECECGYITEKLAHSMVDEKCSECGYHEHVFEKLSGYDADSHSLKCRMCELTEQKPHNLIDCECDKCDYTEHDFKISSDCEYHWQYCEKCGKELEKIGHTPDIDGACADCGGQMHVYTLKYDATAHVYECTVCGVPKDRSTHSFTNGTCELCGYKEPIKTEVSTEKATETTAEQVSTEPTAEQTGSEKQTLREDKGAGCIASAMGTAAVFMIAAIALLLALRKKESVE